MNASAAAAQQNEVKLFFGFSPLPPAPASTLFLEENFHKNSNLFKLLNFLLRLELSPGEQKRSSTVKIHLEK